MISGRWFHSKTKNHLEVQVYLNHTSAWHMHAVIVHFISLLLFASDYRLLLFASSSPSSTSSSQLFILLNFIIVCCMLWRYHSLVRWRYSWNWRLKVARLQKLRTTTFQFHRWFDFGAALRAIRPQESICSIERRTLNKFRCLNPFIDQLIQSKLHCYCPTIMDSVTGWVASNWNLPSIRSPICATKSTDVCSSFMPNYFVSEWIWSVHPPKVISENRRHHMCLHACTLICLCLVEKKKKKMLTLVSIGVDSIFFA